MNILIKTIPHEEQRYPTVGDWQWVGDDLEITISSMKNWKYEFLVAFHELAEVMLCKDRNISQKEVDDFDVAFEDIRLTYPKVIGDQEPGNNENAPYYKEHQFATEVEVLMAEALGVNWKKYDKTVNNL